MCDGQEFVESKWNCIFLPSERFAPSAPGSVSDSAAVLRAAPVLVLLLCVLVCRRSRVRLRNAGLWLTR